MTANEKSIAWESADGSVWVLDTKRAYFVMRAGPVPNVNRGTQSARGSDANPDTSTTGPCDKVPPEYTHRAAA